MGFFKIAWHSRCLLARMSRNNTNQSRQAVTKKTCKNMLRLSAVAALIGTPAVVMANPVTLTQNSYSYLDAGEFTANNTGVNPSTLGYASSTSTSSTFETFCVETAVDFTPGTGYYYNQGSTTGTGVLGENGQGGIALSEGTAFLYYEFATGGLNGGLPTETAAETYNYTSGTAGYNFSRLNDAGLLQVAIWYFMGESLPNGYNIPGGYSVTTDPFVVLAEAALGGSAKAFDNDGAAAGDLDYGVAIMQLTTGNSNTGTAAQNQLILTGTGTGNNQSVPDGGMTLTMLGMGLAGLFYVNFRRTNSVARQN
jgi:hypothetical protein